LNVKRGGRSRRVGALRFAVAACWRDTTVAEAARHLARSGRQLKHRGTSPGAEEFNGENPDVVTVGTSKPAAASKFCAGRLTSPTRLTISVVKACQAKGISYQSFRWRTTLASPSTRQPRHVHDGSQLKSVWEPKSTISK
jgi:hypothetical protein